jgi:NitT/TauT family transport system substrate-binding protein
MKIYHRVGIKGTIFALLVSLLGISSCAKSPEKEAAKALPTIRIGLIVQDAVRPALVVAAEELGYYKEEGVNVEFVSIDTVNSGLASVETRKVDIFPFAASALSSIAKGSNHVIIGGTAVEGSSLVASKENADVDFKDFKNWKGKKIAADPTTANMYLLQEYIRSVYPEYNPGDILWTPFDDGNVLLEAIRKGSVDAGFLTTERVWLAEESGLREAFDLAEFLPYYLCCRQTAHLDGVKANREAYVAVIRAQLRAEHDYATDLPKIVSAVAKYTEQKAEYIVRYIGTEKAFDGGGLVNYKNPVSPDPLFNKIEHLYEVNITLGNYAPIEGVNLKDHVDLTIYQEAIKDLIARYPDDAIYQKAYELFQLNNSRYFL